MRVGGLLSLLLHLVILLLILFGLPDLFRQEEVAAPVAVQLATLADITAQPIPKQTPPVPVVKQTPPPPAPTPPVPPTPPTPPVEQPVEQTPPPEPPPPEPPKPAPQTVEQPQPPEPVPIPEQQPTPPPPQEAKIEPPPAPILRPANLKPPKQPKPVQPPQDFSSLLKNVEKMKQASPETQQTPPADSSQPPPSVSELQAPQMTSSERDSIASQIEQAWFFDAGTKGSEDIVVDVRVTLAQDGTVLTAVIVDQARMATDGYYRAAAEAARRAVLKASPLKVPPEKYETWKEMLLHFNPQGLMGL
jgi:hypothetical protein